MGSLIDNAEVVETENSAVEEAIKAYRDKKRKESRRGIRKRYMKRLLEKNPNYYIEWHEKHRDVDLRYERKRDARLRETIPEELSFDILEWMKRRCLSRKNFAVITGYSEGFIYDVLSRRRKPNQKIIGTCGLKYTFGDRKYIRKYPESNGLCSICGECNTYGCSWSDKFIPVQGWNAIRRDIATSKGIEESYLVIGCPLYSDRDVEDNNELESR